MKLRAINPIKNGAKWVKPGKGFDCNKEDAEGLISAGYAELFTKEEKGEEAEALKGGEAETGGGEDTGPAPSFEDEKPGV